MSAVTLKAVRTEEISFTNQISPDQQIKFEDKYTYFVRYTKNNVCRGEFTAYIRDRAKPDEFKIKATVVGVFDFDSNAEKERIHAESYHELFPYVRSLISTITSISGVSAVMIPFVGIEKQQIFQINNTKPDKKNVIRKTERKIR